MADEECLRTESAVDFSQRTYHRLDLWADLRGTYSTTALMDVGPALRHRLLTIFTVTSLVF